MTPEPEPESSDSHPPQAPKRSKAGMVARRLMMALGAFVLLVLGAVGAIVYTSVGARVAVVAGLKFYNGLIPGNISVARVEGSVAGGLTLEEIRIEDGNANPLVVADRLRVSLAPFPALGKRLELGDVEVDGAEVFVLEQEGGGFGDLAPSGEPAPAAPRTRFGPDLPVEILGRVIARDSALYLGTPDAPVLWVQAPELTVQTHGGGLAAWASLEGQASVPPLGLDASYVTVSASWSEPRAEAVGLRVESNWGTLDLDGVAVDLAAETLEVRRLAFAPDDRWLAENSNGMGPTDATLVLDGFGTPDAIFGDALLEAAEGSVSLDVRGSYDSGAELGIWLAGEVSRVPGAEHIFTRGILLSSYVHAQAARGEGLVAELDAECAGCALDPVPVLVAATASVEPQWRSTSATVSLHHGRSEIYASGAALSNGRRHADLDVAIPQMSSFAPLLRALGVTQTIEGELEARAECTAERSISAAKCTTSVAVSKGSPIRTARLAATLGADRDGWKAGVSELFVQALGAKVRKTGPTVVATYSHDGEASLSDLQVSVETRTGRGDVTASATMHPNGNLDGAVHLASVDLAAVRAFLPQLPLAGVVNADVSMAGSLEDPRIEVTAEGKGLALGRGNIGSLSLNTSYVRRRWKIATHTEGGHLGRLALDGDIPLVLDLRRGSVALLPSRQASIAIASDAIELAPIVDVAPKLASLEGSVALDARLEGSFRRPTLTVAADVVAASYASHRLPDVQLDVKYAAGGLSASVHASHPAARNVEAEFQIPIDLDVLGTDARWRYKEEHTITLEADGILLGELRAWLPEAAIEGKVSIRGSVRGPATAATVALDVHGRGLRYQDRSVGRVDIETRHAAGVLHLTAQTTSPAIGGFGLDCSVPIGLDPASGKLAWRHDEPHELDAFVSGLVIERVLDWVPGALDVGGRVSVHIAGSGSAAQPQLDVTASGDRLRYGPRRLGEVKASASYAQQRVGADAKWTVAPGRTVDVRASVPVDFDLPNFAVALLPEQQHSLRLAAPRVDRVMLAPFVELGEEFNSPLAVHMVADGNQRDFLASAALVGISRTGGRVQPVGGRIVIGPREQSLSMSVGDPASPWVGIVAKTSAPLVSVLEGSTSWETVPLTLGLDVNDVALDFFEALLPPVMRNLEGTVNAHIGASGTLGAPETFGELRVRDAAATIVSARTRIRGFGLDMDFNNRKVEISNIAFDSGAGSLSGRGIARFSRETGLDAEVTLDAKKLPILRPGLPRMEYTGTIRAEAAFRKQEGRVEVGLGKTVVAVLDSGVRAGKAVDTNEGIVLVDLERDGATFEERDPIVLAPARDGTFVGRLVLDDPLRIVGGGINMTWTGGVGVRHENGVGSVEGSLAASDGTLALLGNDFELRSGQVTLPATGSLVPFIDAEAVTTVDGVDVSAVVRGRITRPDLVLSSTPALSQSEIFSALVTGSADSAEADSDQVGAKAASLLVAVRSQALQQQMSERLRVDRIGFGFGDDAQQPILTIGKNLTKKLYGETEFHHNAPPDENGAELRLRYRFAPRWSLESFMGDAAASGLGVYWSRAFATQRRLRKQEGEPEPVPGAAPNP